MGTLLLIDQTIHTDLTKVDHGQLETNRPRPGKRGVERTENSEKYGHIVHSYVRDSSIRVRPVGVLEYVAPCPSGPEDRSLSLHCPGQYMRHHRSIAGTGMRTLDTYIIQRTFSP